MKTLFTAFSILLIASACNMNREDASKDLQQKEQEVNKEYNEEVQDASKERGEELNEAREDFSEEQREEFDESVDESDADVIRDDGDRMDVNETQPVNP